jgi:hypothetical protein
MMAIRNRLLSIRGDRNSIMAPASGAGSGAGGIAAETRGIEGPNISVPDGDG